MITLIALACVPSDDNLRQPADGWAGADEPDAPADPPVGDPTQPEATPGNEPPPLPDALPRSIPLLGGSLAAGSDWAVVADAEVDVLIVLDFSGDEPAITTPDLHPGDVPFRVDIEGDVAWATLRGPGGLAIYDRSVPLDDRVVRRVVAGCPEPRGVDATATDVWVACASGEIVQLDLAGQVLRSQFVEEDLRDVVVVGDRLFVSRFKTAEILVVDPADFTFERLAPTNPMVRAASPTVGWRMVPYEDGVVLAHTLAADPVDVLVFGSEDVQNPWGAPTDLCNQQLSTHLTRVLPQDDGTYAVDTSDALNNVILPLDVQVISANEVRLVSAGETSDVSDTLPTFTYPWSPDSDDCIDKSVSLITTERPVAVREVAQHTVVVTGNPTRVYIDAEEYLSWARPADAQVELFHASTDAGISCAACHPEGGEDGHVWLFSDAGLRRTQTLSGSLMSRAPFHWSGDLPTLRDLMVDVFVDRMIGHLPDDDEIDALGEWLDGLAPVRVSPHDGNATRGALVFQDAGCADCHSGALFTDNRVLDVGGGEAFKVPTLIGVGSRAPYMHDGCAPDLVARFTDPACAVAEHGAVPVQDVVDLVAYLQTL